MQNGLASGAGVSASSASPACLGRRPAGGQETHPPAAEAAITGRKEGWIRDCLLDTLATPANLRQCSLPQLERLAEEIRSQIIETVSLNGGRLRQGSGWWS